MQPPYSRTQHSARELCSSWRGAALFSLLRLLFRGRLSSLLDRYLDANHSHGGYVVNGPAGSTRPSAEQDSIAAAEARNLVGVERICLDGVQHLLGKTLFSVDGRVGVGGSYVQDGDEVIVTLSLGGVFLLRRAVSGKQGGAFRLVDRAYLDGLMRNKWEDQEFCQEIIQRPTETVKIY